MKLEEKLISVTLRSDKTIKGKSIYRIGVLWQEGNRQISEHLDIEEDVYKAVESLKKLLDSI